MSEINEKQMIFIDEEGNEVKCDILFKLNSEEFGKSYVFFTVVGAEDENGNVEVSVAVYNPNDKQSGELFQVETEEELKYLREIFVQLCDSQDDCEDCDECDCEDCEECDCEHCSHCE